MSPEGYRALDVMLAHYERRVRKSRETHKVEVHIPLDHLGTILRLARVAFYAAKAKETTP